MPGAHRQPRPCRGDSPCVPPAAPGLSSLLSPQAPLCSPTDPLERSGCPSARHALPLAVPGAVWGALAELRLQDQPFVFINTVGAATRVSLVLWSLSPASRSSAPRCSGSSPGARAGLPPLPAPGERTGLSAARGLPCSLSLRQLFGGRGSAARAGAAALLSGAPTLVLRGRVGRAPLLLAAHSPPQRLPCELSPPGWTRRYGGVPGWGPPPVRCHPRRNEPSPGLLAAASPRCP